MYINYKVCGVCEDIKNKHRYEDNILFMSVQKYKLNKKITDILLKYSKIIL